MPHRHSFEGRKHGRGRDQRRALYKGLATSLIDNKQIETTLPKAKDLIPYVERLITKAKKGDLHNRRQVISAVSTVASAHKLVDEIAPKLSGRVSGHLRVTRTRVRRGDNAQLASVSFVDDLTEAPVAKKAVSESSKADVAEKTTTKASGVKPKAKSSKKGDE